MSKTKVDELRESLEKRKAAESISSDADMDAELSAAKEEAKAHYDKLLRAMADFENYRKRMERDKQDLVKFANENLIRELLNVLDHLDQALSHIKQGSSDEARNLALGVELVAKQLVGALEKFGLKAVDAEAGQHFDPQHHEALQMVDAEDAEPGTVLAQHRRGYMLNDRLLRAALVDVVKEK
jgi:molecular chaperone GrpE